MLTTMTADLHLAPPANPTPIPKGRIGRFVYEKEIGQGSVGIVYQFRDPLIGRKVAIKILNPQLPANQRQLFEKHFIQEARAAGRLNHPNIVTVYDADKSGDLLFIVMEYLEGKELRELLGEGHPFNYKQIADMVARIANALDYAHENGVIHRDIKPANIFISGTSSPKVLDFGIASASRQITDVDSTLGHDQLSERRLLGTPNYMSPEQTRSETVDARTDIFSLGVVLYQLLCGQLPFKGNDVHALLKAIANDPAIPPQEIKADVPLRLARIAAKALSKKPADRYQRASEMARDLNRFLEKERTERILAKIQNPEQNKINPADPNSAFKLDSAAQKNRLETRKLAFAAGIVLALLLILSIANKLFSSKPPPPAPAPETLAENVPQTQPESSKPAAPTVTLKEPARQPKPLVAPELASVAAKRASKPKPLLAPAPAEAPVIKYGSLAIAVSPWGEVFVDGQSKGVSPPLNKLKLPTGKHKIEIKNEDESYAVQVEVNTEKEIKIAHRF